MKTCLSVMPLVAAFFLAGCGDDDGGPGTPLPDSGTEDSGATTDTTDTDETDTTDTDETDTTDTDETDTTDTDETDTTDTDEDAGTTDVPDIDGSVPDSGTGDMPETGAPEGDADVDGGMTDGDADVTPDAMTPDADVEEEGGSGEACLEPTTATAEDDCLVYTDICTGGGESLLAAVCFTNDQGVMDAVLACYEDAGEELDDCAEDAENTIWSCWAAAEANACVTDVPECEAVTDHCDDVTEAQCDELVAQLNPTYLEGVLPGCINDADPSSCATDIPNCVAPIQ